MILPIKESLVKKMDSFLYEILFSVITSIQLDMGIKLKHISQLPLKMKGSRFFMKKDRKQMPMLITLNIEAVPNSFSLKMLPKEDRKKFLKQLYGKDLIGDIFESGACQLVNGEFKINLSRSMSSIAGLLFEAFIVRKTTENKEFRKELYMWIKEGKRKLSDKEIDKIKILGLGFPKTAKLMPPLYAPQHTNHDIGVVKLLEPIEKYIISSVIFHDDSLSSKNNQIRVVNKPNGLPIGAQIKAITTNEKSEIITPIMKGQYSHVLTLLRNSKTKKHTVEQCRSILDKMVENKEIDLETRFRIEKSIRSPESLGLRQEEIDEYYETVQYWYEDGMKNDGIIPDPLGQQVAKNLV
ncbi:hypothetical protein [Metabacillus fastidiosus]|uniref:hypothetical protein n=1 Tax=Metabacillus fastidiosus TaxID=1458 RepID=UPI00082516FC|nr:hypothetical protein [Metabacillus fastidiosus]